jgi:AcrR family transcriptional regulator
MDPACWLCQHGAVPYHHGSLREALVEAGVQLAAESGPDAVVLREVSRRVGVSHNAAYRHFADRDALLHEVSARAMAAFGAVMAARVAATRQGPEPEAVAARLEATGRGYVQFAVEQPGLFRTACAFSLGDVAPHGDAPHPYAQLSAGLDAMVTAGLMTPARREGAEIAAWSAVHGFAVLVMEGPLAGVPEAQREAMLDVVLRVVREGL